MNKRAQSQIITTVLIILLVLAAIVIVWQVVQSTIESGAGTIEGTASCIGIDLEILSTDATANTINVRRASGGDMNAVANVRFIVNGATATPTTNPSSTDLEPLETKQWGLTLSSADKVEVAAILNDDDSTICNIMDDAIVA
jgi:hypothetical protein